MSKFIVTVFDDEKSAYEGSKALSDLDRNGNVVCYAAAVIAKDAQGAVHIKDGADEGPVGTLVGMLVGGLVGALGGPETMVAGAAGGSLGGWFGDLYNLGVDAEFLDDVGSLLTPGKCAVVAEVAEGWTAPVDTRMEELGGTVYRRYRADVEDAQIERDIAAANAELDELEEEWDQAVGEAKDKLKTKVDKARAKMKSLHDKAEAKLASMEQECDAKIKKMDEQIAKAKDDAKAKFEKRRTELKAEYDTRSAKLKQAATLTAEALS